MGAPNPVCEITSHLAGAQGKGIRTLLLLYAAMDSDGLVPCDAVKAAAAIELFHMATLVHDDVIDDAPLRRGIPTVQHKFGKKNAVICGDYLLCLAASLIMPLHTDYQEYTGLLPAFTSALSRTCMGELRQLHNNRNIALGIPGYLRIIADKTAALFYVAAFAGALIARYTHDEAMRLARFGRYFGMVFQIVDDCKDYEISEAEALKTVGKDFSEGVVTLPLIYAFRNSPQLREMAKGAFDDAVMARRLAKAVCDADGTRKSRDLAARYADKARLLLASFPAYKTNSLLELLSKSIGKERA
jgi:heptaprenyl diphosphate synthase